MMRSMLALFMFIAFAGRVLAQAVNITVGNSIFTPTQLLAFPNGTYSAACMTQCNTAQQTINACGDNNATCICTNTVGQQLQACEECLFTQLIDMNIRAPDIRVGANSVLAGLTTTCTAANKFVFSPALALTLPANWVGPTSAVLPLPVTIIVVLIGGALASGAFYLLVHI